MKPTRTSYLIELVPPASDAQPHVRLKRALKCLLRAFGLRCVSVAQKTPGATAGVVVNPEAGAAPAAADRDGVTA